MGNNSFFSKRYELQCQTKEDNNLDNPITQREKKKSFFCIEGVSDGNEKGIKMTVQRHSLR